MILWTLLTIDLVGVWAGTQRRGSTTSSPQTPGDATRQP